MTTLNEFLPFADAANANIIPYQAWYNGATRFSGFVAGIAKSNEINRVLAQGANAGYAMAKFIERLLDEDVYVDKPERLVDQFYRAMVEMSYRATPIGCALTFPVYLEIEGFVMTNFGGDISRTDYDRLFGVYGTKFNSASTPSTKFGIPNAAGRFWETAAELSQIGCFVAAGLPNIAGTQVFRNVSLSESEIGSILFSLSGAFSTAEHPTASTTLQNGSGTGSTKCDFSAQKCSSLFGKSTTIQPLALRALSLIRAY